MSGKLVELEAFATLPRHARLMGLDIGAKTIGLSLSDVERVIASPLDTIIRAKFTKDAQELVALIMRHGVGGLVLGLPRNMDGARRNRLAPSRATLRPSSSFPSPFGTSASPPPRSHAR